MCLKFQTLSTRDGGSQQRDQCSFIRQVQCREAGVPVENHHPLNCCCPGIFNSPFFSLEVMCCSLNTRRVLLTRPLCIYKIMIS